MTDIQFKYGYGPEHEPAVGDRVAHTGKVKASVVGNVKDLTDTYAIILWDSGETTRVPMSDLEYVAPFESSYA